MAMYNTSRYNEQTYNYMQLNESLTLSDAALKDSTKQVSDIVFTVDNLTKQVTDKVLSEQVKLGHWISIDEKRSSTWSD